MASEFNPTLRTNDGLVLKNTSRIEEIDCRLEARVDAKVYSWKCSRLFRRDYNLVCSKMYIRSLNKDHRKNVLELLHEIVLQSEFLKGESNQYQVSLDLPATVIPLRIVGSEGALLFKTIMAIDDSIARIHSAHLAGLVRLEALQNAPELAIGAFNDLKKYVVGSVTKATSNEIGRQSGIT